jgi:hypothetical protein
MRWDYSIERYPSGVQLVPGEYYPYGIKIIKTLYDDSDQVVVVMDATPEDARDNAEEGFINEYITETKNVFSEQLDYLFSLNEDGSPSIKSTSHGASIGRYISNSLTVLVALTSAGQ